ncbi:hypothetical protein BDQ12DRAFT_712067 [Crucibulum laeve]|uniref:Fork-head domain-containing protein n=1 Tax=Crucibulum laeve TaxID=68775 RepID=A0A5C3M834_9AGAR|nr:hypothetical protein BDQ12DRAFT_712067 [Crucibulum laeve]
MADPTVSPISQLLHTLGITRDDLNKRSDQMRQFLTAESDVLPARVVERDNDYRSRSGSDLRSVSRSSTSTTSFSRSLSRARSDSLREDSPPVTPVKTEPRETSSASLRHYDSMEMVIERQRQSRRERKSRRGKERESTSRSGIAHPPSPSPSNASRSSHSIDSHSYSRDSGHSQSLGPEDVAESSSHMNQDPPPVTPQKNKYYRDHTLLSSSSQPHKEITAKVETPTPTRPPPQPTPQMHPIPPYYAYPAYMGYPQYLPMGYRPAQAGSSVPVTPQAQRTLQPPPKKAPVKSPLPPSSPPVSSPMSSPVRRTVNLVSSPGPMGPLPTEDDYESLPYTLPPGPYSPNKPDLSYAALVGRAILSSPEHRLTLQEIYDWITIVYPYYKRGETTWMNSIRHVLSTTVCFRKVPRERSVGRTLWAIWDEDLECFKGGGFRKQLCKDIANGNDGKGGAGSAKGKGRVKKRAADEDETVDARKPKRARKEQAIFKPVSMIPTQMYTLPPPLASHPLFPPSRPTSHHQPYYESCLPQTQHIPAEIIFPPLPAAAAFNQVVSQNATTASSSYGEAGSSPPPDAPPPSSQSSASSVPSVPELTPNRSSSPPSSLPSTSDMDVDLPAPIMKPGDFKINAPVTISGVDDDLDLSSASGETEDGDDVFNTSLLGPVRFWGESPKAAGGLQPGIELINFDNSGDEEDDGVYRKDARGKKNKGKLKASEFPPIPTSPTPVARKTPAKASQVAKDNASLGVLGAVRSASPPPASEVPSTPPRKAHHLPMSSVRTPISSSRTPFSYKGLHMSPSTSLAHYKSNLDPPPALTYVGNNGESGSFERRDEFTEELDPMRTPRKRTTSGGAYHPPVTPKRLVFPSLGDSPFRTPGYVASPFRTPRSRSIFDPHDPRTLLNDELSRMGSALDDSPGGIFGKSRGSLLYDSPGFDSPGKHQKWW